MFLLLLACALPDALNDTDADADTGADTGPNTAPSLAGLAVSHRFVETGGGSQEPGEMPQIVVRQDWWAVDAQLSDTEGDLGKLTVRLWLEPDGDGAVSGPPAWEEERGTDGSAPVYSAPLGIALSLGEEEDPRFGATYDLGAQIVDARGAESAIAVTTATTPPAP